MSDIAPPSPAVRPPPRRVFVVGGTGTIGRAAVRALVRRGHDVVCLARPRAGVGGALAPGDTARLLEGAQVRYGTVTDPVSLARDGFRGERFDAVLSCLASRTGSPRDAWAIDHEANSAVLAAAREAGVRRFVLLSAICVQKPLLEFQKAKLAFEATLASSGLAWTVVRPTAFFKSLTGQVERVRRGRAYLVFGDGRLTACKPIGDDDLADFLAACIEEDRRAGRVLSIGGPGPAVTPLEQAEHLFALLGRPPRIRRVPVMLLDGVAGALSLAGRFSPALADKAELARIGRYYATESMLVLDPATGRYDADATPSTGTETLFDFQARLVRGEASAERGDHAVF